MDDPGPDPKNGPLFQSRRRQREGGRPVAPILGGVVLALLVAGAAWMWLRSDGRMAPQPNRIVAADSGAASDAAPPPDPVLDLPELDSSDVVLRQVLSQLSNHPEWAKWLVPEDLIRRFVTSVVNVAGGESPRSHVEFLAPEGSFETEAAGDGLAIDPASYRRYDLLTETFLSLEPEVAARWYRLLHPLFEEAHRELGLRDRTFDESLAAAMGVLLAVQVPDGEVLLRQNEAVFEYQDPALESLTAAQKHLLRLGPANATRVQDQLRDLASSTGITPVEPTRGR